MNTDEFRSLRRCSDEELKSLRQRAEVASRETWVTVTAGLYLIWVAPALVFALLWRAYERSHWFEIVTWLACTLFAIWAGFRWQRFKLDKRERRACIEEQERRRSQQ